MTLTPEDEIALAIGHAWLSVDRRRKPRHVPTGEAAATITPAAIAAAEAAHRAAPRGTMLTVVDGKVVAL